MIFIRDAIIEELTINDSAADVDMQGCKIQSVVIGSKQEDVTQDTIKITHISD